MRVPLRCIPHCRGEHASPDGPKPSFPFHKITKAPYPTTTLPSWPMGSEPSPSTMTWPASNLCSWVTMVGPRTLPSCSFRSSNCRRSSKPCKTSANRPGPRDNEGTPQLTGRHTSAQPGGYTVDHHAAKPDDSRPPAPHQPLAAGQPVPHFSPEPAFLCASLRVPVSDCSLAATAQTPRYCSTSRTSQPL